MNEIAGSLHTAIQAESVYGTINVGRSDPPDLPVAVCAEAVEWSEFIAVEDDVEELLTCADTIEIVAQRRGRAQVVIGARKGGVAEAGPALLRSASATRV